MSKFAKIFEFTEKGDQLLVKKYYNRSIEFWLDGNLEVVDFQTQEERNTYFDSFDQDAAVKMYEEMTKG